MTRQRARTELERLGHLLIIGFDGTEMTPGLARLLRRIQPAGVILFARNMVNAQQTYRLLKACQALIRERLFACVDLEGGRVDRFRDLIGPSSSAADVFSSHDPKLYRKHGRIIGNCCRALGFNVDFAPVLDLAFEASRRVMDSRSVSADPNKVILYAREFLSGLRRAGILGAGKHFPGLGEGKLDSHHHLPVIKKSLRRLWQEDLVPYRRLRRQLPMVMVSHANYPAVTRDRLPASLSRGWITGILRRRIAYRGLIVSDDLEMDGVLKARPVERAAVEFLAAGGDLCLVCHERENVEKAFQAIVDRAERDRGFRRRAIASVKRVNRFKQQALGRQSTPPAPSEAKVRRLSTQLWEFSEQVRLEALSAASEVGENR